MSSNLTDPCFETFYRAMAPAGQFGPMADLMPSLQAELQRRGLTAFTSHATFCISRHTAYPEGSEGALVRIWPHHTGLAQVVFDEAEDGLDDNKPIVDFRDLGELVPYAGVLARLQPLLDRL